MVGSFSFLDLDLFFDELRFDFLDSDGGSSVDENADAALVETLDTDTDDVTCVLVFPESAEDEDLLVLLTTTPQSCSSCSPCSSNNVEKRCCFILMLSFGLS